MVTLFLLLAIAALLVSIAAAIGRAPLWVAVVLLAIMDRDPGQRIRLHVTVEPERMPSRRRRSRVQSIQSNGCATWNASRSRCLAN